MMWWLPLTRATLKPVLSNARTIRSPGKMGRVASGHVNRERELLWCAKLGDQPFKRLAQVSHGSLAGITFAVSARTGTQLSVGAPHTVFILRHGRGGPRPAS